MTYDELHLIFLEYKKQLSEDIKKGFYKGEYDKESMILWGADEMLLFLNKRGLLGK